MSLKIPPEQFHKLYSEFPVASCLIDRDGRFINANQEYERIVGQTASELSGRLVSEVCGPEIAENVQKDFTALDQGLPVKNHELTFGERTFLVAVRDLRQDGIVSAICVALTDITPQKQFERQLSDANRQLNETNDKLTEIARTDTVTGLWNRHALEQLLPREIARSRREATAISVLLVDIDHFKSYNDSYGHLAGDETLRLVGQALKGALRHPGDFAARYGGEEFAIVLPATDVAGAMEVAKLVREAVRRLTIPHDTSPLGQLTISIGIACIPFIARTSDIIAIRTELIDRADQALYAVKTATRDGIRLFEPKAEAIAP